MPNVAPGSATVAHPCTTAAPLTVFAIRHGNKLKKLNLPADQRRALLRALVTEVLRHGRITTTKVSQEELRRAGAVGRGMRQKAACAHPLAYELLKRRRPSLHPPLPWLQVRAKAVRKHVDHIITLAKNGSLHARRQVGSCDAWS